ncbi:hypothetical protein [Bacillus gaemokensis]|uniref:Uncharacterized protein n=1 Tax=Bacillus gaemokensis TaxID=574375 RepID=A0A073KCE0_9BACI|nr:hypothetical protein [Bacillus gaemokensis]KEK24201.1 hypothetical protein BAGA_27895 [Bacillus gaemokensis]KYG38284.1 hypothetical protein AZF08_19815 [Bacillus gaemokensis]
MPRNIPLIIEYIAFLGLICCLLIYNTNVVFLSIVILFVIFETLMEVFKIRLKQKISHIYTAFVTFSSLITNVIYSGFHAAAIFPVFFVGVLLVISQYIYIPKHRKQQQEA